MAQTAAPRLEPGKTAFLFDLDGTLVDSVYQHVLAWHEALDREKIPLSVWRIHRRIGMSGGLFANALLRELGREITPELTARLREGHAQAFLKRVGEIRPLPGAVELLQALTEFGTPWAIATSGHAENARGALHALHVDLDRDVIVTGDQVTNAKPAPDLFLAAAKRLGRTPTDAFVVGDSVWDMEAAKAANARAIGLRCGGYADSELRDAGAAHVYDDPAHLSGHLAEFIASV